MLFSPKKRHPDTVIWLFAFKIVGSLFAFIVLAVWIDVTRFIDWIHTYAG